MPPSESQKRATAKWQRENMSTLVCKMRKEQADAFKEYAAANGTTANNMIKEFVLRCLDTGHDIQKKDSGTWAMPSVEEMRRRQAAGIEAARARGVYDPINHKGRTRALVDAEAFEAAYQEYSIGLLKTSVAASKLGLSEAQTRRRFKEREMIGEGYDPNVIPGGSNK